MFSLFLFWIISFSKPETGDLKEEKADLADKAIPDDLSFSDDLLYDNNTIWDKDDFLDDDDDGLQRYDENGVPICGENAEFVNNQCECKEGFLYGDPRSELGCYNCKDKCSSYADCIYPGHCECSALYTGNGTFCKFNTPSITSVKEVGDSLLLVSIYYPSDQPLTMGFCKFGDIVVQGKNVSSTQMYCKIPQNIPEHCVFKISENTDEWTTDSIIYESKVSDQVPGKKNTGMIVVFALSMLVVSVLMFNTRSPQRIEAHPFIREKPKPGEIDIQDNSDIPRINTPLPPLGPDDIDDNNNLIPQPYDQQLDNNNQGTVPESQPNQQFATV